LHINKSKKINQNDQWHSLNSVELDAYNHPDKEFFTEFETKYKKVDFWHYRETKIAKKSVHFDSKLQKMFYKQGNFVTSEKVKIAWNVLSLMIILIFLVIFNFIIYNKAMLLNAFVFAITIALVIAFAFVFAFIFVSVFAFIFSKDLTEEEKKKNLKINQRLLVVNYLLIGIHLIFWAML